jgi:hypothetical protein
MLSPESREIVRNTKREELIQFHLSSWGMGIRAELGLWGQNVCLLQDLSPNGAIHADDASMILICGVWDRLQDQTRPTPHADEVRKWLGWNNGAVRALAISIRESGHGHLLPILADALEEAGCIHAEILSACRQGVSDFDGDCWVLRVLLDGQ